MYLTRMELDTTRRSAMRALSMPNCIHGAVESAFAGGRSRRLWRIDCLRGKQYLLLVSEDKPRLDAALAQFGLAEKGWESKPYQPFLDRIEAGSVWRFRLVANPTYSVAAEGKNGRGAVRAHKTVAHQEAWLVRKAAQHGFSLPPEQSAVCGVQWQQFRKGESRNRVSVLAVTYEGLLRVDDAERFRAALAAGIGRGKAYGMGMLTVVPYHGVM